jgi:hypothetical protein
MVMGKALRFIDKEVRELVPPTLFFLVVFHMLAMTQAVARGQGGISLLRSVAATLGALTVGKAILIVDALPIGRRFEDRAPAVGILWKTLLFGLLTVLFHYLEEVLPHVREQGSFAAAHRHAFEETSWPHILVLQAWLWSAVLLYATLSEVIHRYGWPRVKDELFRGRSTAAPPVR